MTPSSDDYRLTFPPLVRGRRRRQRPKNVLLVPFAGLCAVLIFGPLALGVVQPWSIALFEGSSAVLFLVWLACSFADEHFRLRWNPLLAPMFAFLLLALTQVALLRTAYAYASRSELWLLLAYGALFVVAVHLVQGKELMRFGLIMTAFGSLYAIFSILQGFTSENRIYWWIKPHSGTIYGSFVNRNNFAGLMEMLCPLAMLLALSCPARSPRRILLILASILMAASIILSQSRGGMIALVAETIFLAVIWSRRLPPGKFARVLAAFAVATAIFVAWVAPQRVLNRLTDVHDNARLLIHRDSIPMFLAHPLLGSGLGTFPTVFPRYRRYVDPYFANHAHDDYLELLLETGLLGFAAAVWFVVQLYRHGLRTASETQEPSQSLVSAAALAGCTGLLVHSFTDFNLHIPANAALFFVLCAVATASEKETEQVQ
jgi:O-antigen ligase